MNTSLSKELSEKREIAIKTAKDRENFWWKLVYFGLTGISVYGYTVWNNISFPSWTILPAMLWVLSLVKGWGRGFNRGRFRINEQAQKIYLEKQ